MSRTLQSLRSLALAILTASSFTALAQTIAAPFSASYSLVDIGSAAGVPTNFGGLFIRPSQPNTIYIGGAANGSAGALYAVPISRDSGGRIVGFAGSGARVANLPYNDGGIVPDPGGLVSYAKWPSNAFAQVDLSTGLVVNEIPLSSFGVANSSSAVGYIPGGYPGAGGLRIVSYSGGQFYDVAFTRNGRGIVNIHAVTPLPASQLPGGPEGWAYVPLGSPQMTGPTMIVSEYGAGSVAVYDMDANGNPVIASRRLFLSGLGGVEGAAIDPVSGSFLFSTFGGGNRVIVVNGFVAPPTANLSATSLTFSAQPVGSTSPPQSITLTNAGPTPLVLTSIATSGDFASTACPTTLAAGASCRIDVTFTPAATGPRTGSITITSNANGSPHVVNLSGTGVAPHPSLVLTPSSLAFAARAIGTTSSAQTVTLTNNGPGPLAIGAMTITGDFAFRSGCPASLAQGGTCTIDVTFTPIATGARSGMLTIGSNASGSPHTVPLSGTGQPVPVGLLEATPDPLQFDATPIGSTSDLALRLHNAGNATLNFGPASVDGDFALVGNPGDPAACGNLGVPGMSLASGASCAATVRFAPTALGTRAGTIAFPTDGSIPVLTVRLLGTGAVPAAPRALSVQPQILLFGNQPVGTVSDGKTVQLTNTLTSAVVVTDLTTSPQDYIVSDSCTTIASHATCSALVTFLPTAVGSRVGTLTIRTFSETDPYTVQLNGTGIFNATPALEVTPTRIGFGNVILGGGNALGFNLRNIGVVPVVLGAMNVLDDFVISSACPSTLDPGANCSVQVTFFPHTVGVHAASVDIFSNAANSPHHIDLSGTGCAIPTPTHTRVRAVLCGN